MGEENSKEYLQAVKNYVTAHFGQLPVIPLNEGVNPNYLVGTPPQFVIKVGIYCDLDRETTSLEILRKHGIPTAETVLYENKNEKIGHGVLITRYTPHDGQKAHDQVQLGKLFKQIHTITGKKYGPVGRDGNGTYSNWNEYLLSLPSKRTDVLTRALGQNLEKLLELPKFPAKHSFLHLDFTGDNVLIRDGQIVAVIDPHGAFGDPLLDVAYLSAMTVDPKQMRILIKGYSPKGFTPEEIERLRHYRTIAALDKYGIVLQGFIDKPERTNWWHVRKKRMETIISARINGKDDPEFVESFL